LPRPSASRQPASFVVEVFAESPRFAGRSAAAAVFASEIPLSAARPTISRCFASALALLVLGLLFPVLWPWQRVAGLHLVFVGGFTLIAFTVATRVVPGIADKGILVSCCRSCAAAALLVVASAFRVVATFPPRRHPPRRLVFVVLA
jgi:hypothetical protein